MKKEIIITRNKKLFEEVFSHVENNNNITNIISNENDIINNLILKNEIIDLLILDTLDINKSSLEALFSISKKVINLCDGSSIKPFRMCDLIKEIDKNRKSNFLYRKIKEVIYDEEASLVNKKSLTEKENSLLQALCLAENYKLSKQEILEKIWGYSSSVETGTIENHISKLRSKLPEGVLESKNGIVFLDLD